jgi:hypothetical protein
MPSFSASVWHGCSPFPLGVIDGLDLTAFLSEVRHDL